MKSKTAIREGAEKGQRVLAKKNNTESEGTEKGHRDMFIGIFGIMRNWIRE